MLLFFIKKILCLLLDRESFMTKNRLEAFSDGVLAIVITIMVLEMKAPHDASWHALQHLLPVWGSYVISFMMIAIYWGNHHHLLHAIDHINGKILWANTHLLFWLSLIPFATAWMGENNFAQNTVILYAIVLNFCGIAYFILLTAIKNLHSNNEKLLLLLKQQTRKGIKSVIAYCVAIGTAFIHPLIAGAIFILVGFMWLMPDRNIEKILK